MSSDEVAKDRYKAVRSTMRMVEPQPDPPKGKRPERDFCPVWRTVEDLPAAAKIFYQEAANLAAIPLLTLTMTAAQVERRLEVWSSQRLREKRSALEGSKGKMKAQLDDGADRVAV